jgi:chaperone BCS1
MKGKRMEGLDLKAILENAQEKLAMSSSGNSTATMITGLLPTMLLESFIPGYGYIHKIVYQTIGFDITILVTLAVALWLSNKVYSYLYSFAWNFLISYYMADISISSRDEIHDQVIEYLAYKYKMRPSRSLMAETPRRGYWDLENDSAVTRSTINTNGSVQWLNFANQDAKTEPQFTPAIGSHSFWHNGTYFRVKRQEVVVFKTSSYGDNPISDQEKLIISCFGRSTDPIKRFLQEAKDHAHRNHSAKTVIRRPATKERRNWGGRSVWTEVARRPCRPMNTVVLDEDVKFQVMLDINEYLDPSTARWYAIRGIPYRRGYLFHGPPGTGKTSLTFALAGVFGLNIYVVSLLEPTLTEEELGNLFTHLPPRCIVLLEDIDTAGLARVEKKEEAAEESSDEDDDPPVDEKQDALVLLTQLLLKSSKANKHRKGGKRKGQKKSTGGKEKDDEKKGISLSGLLNVGCLSRVIHFPCRAEKNRLSMG